MDDVMSCGRYPKEVVDGIYEIATKYRTPEYPIGVTNQASFDELKLFAERYSKTQ